MARKGTPRTLARARELAPAIAEQAGEIERCRSLTAEVLGWLREAGCLRMGVARAYGGDELPLPELLRVVEALSRADGSVGWTVGQVAIADAMIGLLPSAALDDAYAEGPDMIGAGAVAPKGRAQRQADEWSVSGQWPFVTGCEHAGWIYLTCLELDGRAPRIAADGVPELRLALLPADEVELLDTWHSIGLRGTGSHDVRVARTLCADARSSPLGGRSGEPSAEIPARDQGGLVIAACVCGIAEGAMEAIAELAAAGKRPAFSQRRLADSGLFQDRLGEAAMTLRAARALLASEVEAAWARRERGQTLLERARLLATVPRVVSLAIEVVDSVYELGGGSSVYEHSGLQRRLRDARAAGQHFSAGRDSYALVGSELVGHETAARPS